MRTIIAGSRTADDSQLLQQALHVCGWVPSVVLSGAARGADTLGEQWACEYGVPLERYPAQWKKYGRRAGYLRNQEMADKADALIALWDGESKGTLHMIGTAKRKGLRVFVLEFYL